MGIEHLWVDASTFAAKHQIELTDIGQILMIEGSAGVSRKEQHALALMLFKELVHTRVTNDGYFVPVIEASTGKIALGIAKPHRLYQVQCCARARTGTGNVARILRDLWLK